MVIPTEGGVAKPGVQLLAQQGPKDAMDGSKKKQDASKSAATLPVKSGKAEEEPTKHEQCPACPALLEKECPSQNQSSSNYDSLLQKGNEFKVQLADDSSSLFQQASGADLN